MPKIKKRVGHFCAIFTKTLYSKEWKKLTKSEMILYIYLKAGMNGSNANEIELPYSNLKGVIDKKTFSRAIKGLIKSGWIEKTHQGGLMENASKYKLKLAHDKTLKK